MPTLPSSVSAYYENEPKIFINSQGAASGIFIDILEAVANREDWQLTYVACEWEDCLKKLHSGDIDLMPDVAYSAERDRLFDFHSTPALYSWSQIYRREDIEINSVIDLKNKRIALLGGGIQQSAITDMLAGFGIKAKLIHTTSVEDAFRLVQSGDADAAIAGHYFGDFHKQAYSLTETPIIFQASRLFYVTAQGRRPELLAGLEKHLSAWSNDADSPYYEIIKKWGGHVPDSLIPPIVWKTLLAVTALLLISVFGVVGLRRRVDVKTRQLLESNQQLQRLTRLYAALSQCNQAIVRCTDKDELFRVICRDAVEFGDMKMTWIGMLDEQTGRVTPVASFGTGTDYLSGLHITLNADEPSGRGPTGIALRSRQAYWCQDFAHDPITAPWHERAAQFGWGASASIPLLCRDTVVGVLTMYAGEANAFDEPARNLLGEMAMDVSYALERFASEAERKVAERELQSNQTLIEIAGRVAKIGGWAVKFPEMQVTWSDEVCLLHDMPAGTQPTLEQAISFYAPEYRERIQEVVRLCLQNGAPYDEELQVITAKGNRIWVRAMGQAIKGGDGTIIRIQGAFQDISDRKRAEEEKQANEIRYQQLFNSLITGLAVHEIICDETGNPIDYRFLEINPAFERLTGLKAASIIGHTAKEVIPALEPFWIERYGKVALTGESTRFEHFAQGLNKYFEVSAYSPKLGQFATLFTDTSERYQMEVTLRESEEKYRALTESINDVIWTLDVETLRFTYVSPSVFKLRGYTPEEIMAEPMGAALTPESAELVRSLLDKHVAEFLAGKIAPDQFNTEEVEQPCKDGSTVWTEVVTNLYQDNKTGRVEVRGVTRNISERKKLEASLRKLSLAVEQSPNTIVITDLDANIEYANANFTKETGYRLDEVIGKNPRVLQSGKTPKETYNDMWAHLTRGELWQGELINRRKDGSEYIESVMISPVRQANGRVTNYLAIKEDVTEKRLAEERIEKLAHFDQLTGLPNRALLTERFKFALSMAQRGGEQLTVMFLDLDHFKDVNDTLGHSVGDQLLMEMARRLKVALREEDTVSRQGGDEFVLILPDTDERGAANVAAKLREAISIPFQVDLHELISTPSIGIAIYPLDGEDFETLSKNADTAMYRAKQEGRNDFRFFTAEMQAHSARALQLGNALRHALARNQLQLQYQPQVSIEDGHVVGVEALLRWQHPELGLISPAEFIPIAEDSGQIIPIGEWVLRTAIRQLKDWLDIGLPQMMIAVNLSAAQFRQPNLTELVTRILDEVDLPHEYLELELTEAVAMDDPQGAIEVMDKLHESGIRMSIDDFGTGYSSLSYLKRFKVYKLKIDQSFVHDITDDPDDKAIVTAIINMASSLGMQTIAEGVETAGQLSFLRLQGCNEVQGFYFSKPLSAEQLHSYIQKFGQ